MWTVSQSSAPHTTEWCSSWPMLPSMAESHWVFDVDFSPSLVSGAVGLVNIFVWRSGEGCSPLNDQWQSSVTDHTGWKHRILCLHCHWDRWSSCFVVCFAWKVGWKRSIDRGTVVLQCFWWRVVGIVENVQYVLLFVIVDVSWIELFRFLCFHCYCYVSICVGSFCSQFW